MTAVLTKIQKLIRLADAARNSSEAEATAAALKVQELLQEHGLTLAQVEAAGGESDTPARAKETIDRRVIYAWQTTLMRTLAANNFCLHVISEIDNEAAVAIEEIEPALAEFIRVSRWTKWVPLWRRANEAGHSVTDRKFVQAYASVRKAHGGRSLVTKKHLLVGRKLNVDATAGMYDYLVETLKALRAEDGFTASQRDAANFMEGAVARVCERLDERRRAAERESEAKKQQAVQGNGTGRELVLSDVYGSENDLNNDLLNGFPPGTTATRRAQQEAQRAEFDAKWRQLQAEGVERWQAWYQAHGYGEDAAKVASSRFRKSTRRRSSGRGYRGGHWTQGDERHAQKVNSDSYRAGRIAGDRVGLDGQVGGTANRKRLG